MPGIGKLELAWVRKNRLCRKSLEELETLRCYSLQVSTREKRSFRISRRSILYAGGVPGLHLSEVGGVPGVHLC